MTTPGAIKEAVRNSRAAVADKVAARLAAEAEAEAAIKRAKDAEAAEAMRQAQGVQLWQAMDDGDDEGAALLVGEVGADLLVRCNPEGATPLHSACARSLDITVAALLKRTEVSEALFAPDAHGRTPLHYAAATDSTGDLCAELLGQEACRPNVRDVEGRNAVEVALHWGMSEAGEVLIEAQKRREAAAQCAAEQKAAAVAAEEQAAAEELAKHPDQSYDAGLKAARQGRLDLCMALVQNKQWNNLNEVDDQKRTMLHYAAKLGDAALCSAILARIDFKVPDALDRQDRCTALHLAASNRQTEACRAIIESGRFTAVNERDMQGRTALHHCAIRTDLDTYEVILTHPDCDPAIPDSKGKSAPEYATDRGLQVEVPAQAAVGDIDL